MARCGLGWGAPQQSSEGVLRALTNALATSSSWNTLRYRGFNVGFNSRFVGFNRRRSTYVATISTPVRPGPYRVTSFIRNCAPLGPYSSSMPRALRRSVVGGGVAGVDERSCHLQQLEHTAVQHSIRGTDQIYYALTDFPRNYFTNESKNGIQGYALATSSS